MRRHAKAPTAGSTQRQATGFGRIFRRAFSGRGSHAYWRSGAPKASRLAFAAALLASFAFGASPAAASRVHLFKETLGSVSHSALVEGRGAAIDQSTGDFLVLDAGVPPSIKRFKPDGTPDDFSALGTNAIDGKEGPDATPQNDLDFALPGESQIAVDNSGGLTDGDIYVTQSFPNLVDVFSKTGAYLGQLSRAGSSSFSEACGVAVDSSGAVYVGDDTGGIDKFVPSANPPLNSDNTASFHTTSQPCTLAAGAGPTAGFLFVAQRNGPISKIDSATGELEYTVAPGPYTTVSVDPGTGHVYGVSGSSVFEDFDASGVVGAAELSSTRLPGEARGLGVKGTSGDIYLSYQVKAEVYGAPIVTVPDTTATAATNNTGTHATLNGTVNPAGIELSECFFEWTLALEATPSSFDHTTPCAESPAAIGAGTSPVAVHADLSNLAPNGVRYVFRLAARNPQGAPRVLNQESFETSATLTTADATPVTATGATLRGSVDPDGVAIAQCLFEWGQTDAYGSTAPCVPDATGIGSGASPVPVHADVSGLHPGTVYHFRLKAADANGPFPPTADRTLQTVGPLINATWAEDVVTTEATLKAEVDPEGAATAFHFEYGTSTAYGSETPERLIVSDDALHEVTAFLIGLQPGTTYHYRLIATSPDGTNEGPDRTIRTFRVFVPEAVCPNQDFRYGAGGELPDCRAYEMVSPLDKNNGDIRELDEIAGLHPAALNQSSTSGNKLAYGSYRAFGDSESAPYNAQYIATRGATGWISHGISPPRREVGFAVLNGEFKAFSPDLCQAWLKTFGGPPLSENALTTSQDFYRRQDEECGGKEYEALIPAVLPEGEDPQTELQGFSADLSHTIFASDHPLTADIQPPVERPRLYDRVNGQLRYVCILPNGEPVTAGCTAGGPGIAVFGGNGDNRGLRLQNAISADGSRIFWTRGEFEGPVYVRIDDTETVPVSKAAEEKDGKISSEYWAAARDGSKAIFSTGVGLSFGEGVNLYEFDVDSETTHLIAGGVWGLAGASEDASRIYFVSGEVLDVGAVEGARNLYFYEADGGSGEYRLVGRLAAGTDRAVYENQEVTRRTSEITPDGLHLAFVSYAPLTGYENIDRRNGERVSEVYRYDAAANGGAGKLVCVSCNPSGQRPVGTGNALSVGLPVPISNLQFPRVLSEDGSRLFFESFDALTPRDTNGREDVYEWEAPGVGNCDELNPAFAPSAEGCISLISSGQSDLDSEFVEASPDGGNVFFYTLSSLVPQDYGLQDIYDARVDGGFPLPPEVPECVGDACQSIPAPPNDPTPASAGFHGTGDPTPRRRCARSRRAAKPGSRARRRQGKSPRLAEARRRHGRNGVRCRRANRRGGR